MSDEPMTNRRNTDQLASELDALVLRFDEHYRVDEEMHAETNLHMRAHTENMHAILEKLDTIGDMISAWNNVRGFVRVMGLLGVLAKWITAVGAAVAALWWAIHSGGRQ